jgi:hypothetical protein
VIGPRCNRQVTCDQNPTNDRSESAITINPLDPYNMVASSKRFIDRLTYSSSLAVYVTFDGGKSWSYPTLEPVPGAMGGTTDPALAFDDASNVYLVALPVRSPGGEDPFGMAVYRSPDGGRTWGPPIVIHQGEGDDKQWTTGPRHASGPTSTMPSAPTTRSLD